MLKRLTSYVNITPVGVDSMANILLSTKLCKYVILKQQEDLLVILSTFSDNVSDPENNTFYLQDEILDKILENIENCKRSVISFSGLFKGITNEDKKVISSLELDKKLLHDDKHTKILEIPYFDLKKFINTLEEEIKLISTKYNLNAGDDYNKLYKFLYSFLLNLTTSDEDVVLSNLSNQYLYFKEHSKKEEEYISIYDNKLYKIDILKEIIRKYNKKLELKEEKQDKAVKKGNPR